MRLVDLLFSHQVSRFGRIDSGAKDGDGDFLRFPF